MTRLDLDTPYHMDHVRDDRLNVGCMRCATFLEMPNGFYEWEAHRHRLMPETNPRVVADRIAERLARYVGSNP